MTFNFELVTWHVANTSLCLLIQLIWALDAFLGASGLWLGTRTGAGGTATLTESFFCPQPMAPWTTRVPNLKFCSAIEHILTCFQIFKTSMTEMEDYNYHNYQTALYNEVNKNLKWICIWWWTTNHYLYVGWGVSQGNYFFFWQDW